VLTDKKFVHCVDLNFLLLYIQINIRYLIYKDEYLFVCLYVCLFVCLFVPYTKAHFRTDRNQTLHAAPPWPERDRRVYMGPKFVTSYTFWALFL
jgi:hypothetical protein